MVYEVSGKLALIKKAFRELEFTEEEIGFRTVKWTLGSINIYTCSTYGSMVFQGFTNPILGFRFYRILRSITKEDDRLEFLFKGCQGTSIIVTYFDGRVELK